MKTAFLVQDTQERFNMKRAWFVRAFRLVDPRTKTDLVQPWFDTKKEARAYAKIAGITIINDEAKK